MMEPNYLAAVDDGLICRPAGLWAKEKLDYLLRYMNTFETSMRNKWPERNYIDLFAGPGKNCSISDHSKQIFLGSPLLALNVKYPFSGYYYSEIDPQLKEVLEKRCSASPLFNSLHFYEGDANDVVKIIVRRIHQFSPNSLNLAFLDPEGLELEWSTVAELAKLRCDLIIYYSQGGFERNIKGFFESNRDTRADLFFGTRDWKKIYEPWYTKTETSGLHRDLIDYYKERLKNLGYVRVEQSDEISTEPLIRSTKKNAPLYRLIFASKHSLGEDFWRKIIKRDIHGQQQLF